MPAKKKAKKVTKKAPKKKVAKKAVKKTTKKVTKKTAKSKATSGACSCNTKCKKNEAFWINHGPVVRTMNDLLKAFKEMTDEQFEYHTKREGNDFSAWIKECFQDNMCASHIKKVRSRNGAVRVLSRKCVCK